MIQNMPGDTARSKGNPMMKHLLSWMLVLALGTGLTAQDKKVLVLRQVSIPTLLDVESGLLESLQKGGGGKIAVTVVDLSNQVNQISEKLATSAQVVVTIGTRASVEAVKTEKSRPVVFTGVAYGTPVLIAAQGAGNARMTGTHFANAVEQALGALKSMKPGIRNVAMMVDQKQPNTKGDGDALVAAAKELGVQATLIPYEGEGGLDGALQSLLAAKADGVILPKDTVQIQKAAVLAEKLKAVGLVAMGTDATYGEKKAAVLSFTTPARDVGKLAGIKVLAILSGTAVGTLKVEAPAEKEVVLSASALKASGLTLSKDLDGKITRRVD